MIFRARKMRYLTPFIETDFADRKMIFIGGPRQVGKTTLALSFLRPSSETNPAYYNWDLNVSRDAIRTGELSSEYPILVLDEVHKFARWRSLVKGIYDTRKSTQQIILTGSARLDFYRKGGDSLQGRYHYYRLHPFSLGEILTQKKDLQDLLRFGGFPEPFLKGTDRWWRRWQKERREKVVYGDIRDLERVREVSLIDLMLDELPQRVGSPLSIGNLRDVLQVSHESVERWISILERLYVCFRLAPYGSPRIRAVKKEQKIYFWDWSLVQNSGSRFENMIACHLLKYCHFLEDTEGYRMELRYLRDTDKREVDFVVIQEKRPLFAVECKTGERAVSASAMYFKARVPVPQWYQVHLGVKDFNHAHSGIRVLPFERFVKEVKLP